MPALRIAAAIAMLLLAGCGPSGPDETDMAGCALRRAGSPISSREVADCAINRAEHRNRREQN
jgi:hypothetical protein